MTVSDVRFGLPGRWAPEVIAWLILSHAPGRIVTVKSRVAFVDMTPAVARTVNAFNSMDSDKGVGANHLSSFRETDGLVAEIQGIL